MPYTTLVYMAVHLNGGFTFWWTVLIVFAVLADLGGNGSAANNRPGKKKMREYDD